MPQPFRVSVLISGRGSNLESLIRHAGPYRISCVFSDNPEALGLARAAEAGIRCVALSRKDFASREEFRDALMQAVEDEGADLIALAGFMRVVPGYFVEKHFGRIINIHPALLPKFPGLHTHERVLEAGDREHGATVHFVDPGVDTGPLIAQGKLSVQEDDTAESLGDRVRATIEHRLYPWVVTQLASGTIRLEGGRVFATQSCIDDATRNGFMFKGERL